MRIAVVAAVVLVAGCGACGRQNFEEADAAIDATPPTSNIAFVTSTKHLPTELGSDLAGADAICNARARDAGLPGQYLALLSTSTTPARNRILGSRGWTRADGRPFGDRIEDLLAGEIYYPLSIDENGEMANIVDPVFTGTGIDGGLGTNCSDYTDPGGLIYIGTTSGTTQVWLSDNNVSCAQLGRIYCFGTDLSKPLVVEPTQGRKAFVTVQPYVPAAGGIATADALCNSEAVLGGVGGNFLALLATTTGSAMSRFSLSGANWVRLDGIPLADSPLMLASGRLKTPLNLDPAGTYRIGAAYTGAPNLTIPAGGIGDDCTDWTDAGGLGRVGAINHYDGSFFAYSTNSVCSGAAVYCLEQ